MQEEKEIMRLVLGGGSDLENRPCYRKEGGAVPLARRRWCQGFPQDSRVSFCVLRKDLVCTCNLFSKRILGKCWCVSLVVSSVFFFFVFKRCVIFVYYFFLFFKYIKGISKRLEYFFIFTMCPRRIIIMNY